MIPNDNWMQEWRLETKNEPGAPRGFYWKGDPLWFVAGKLMAEIDQNAPLNTVLNRLADIATYGDCIARKKALAIFESVAPFDPEFVTICNMWAYDTGQPEFLYGDEWSAAHLKEMRMYTDCILHRLYKTAYQTESDAQAEAEQAALETLAHYDDIDEQLDTAIGYNRGNRHSSNNYSDDHKDTGQQMLAGLETNAVETPKPKRINLVIGETGAFPFSKAGIEQRQKKS